MSAPLVRVLRENYQGFTEFKNALAGLQGDIEDDFWDQNHYHREAGNTTLKHADDDKHEIMLNISAVYEVERLCEMEPRNSEELERNLERCVELCKPLSFFKRLTLKQGAEVFRHATLKRFAAGSYVERVGDPVGFVYVVLLGIIFVEQECQDIGNRKAFVHSVVDGKVFGDGWDAAASDGVRHVSTIAQEDSLVLRISTPDYQKAMRSGDTDDIHSSDEEDEPENNPITKGELSWLHGVGEHELHMLAMMTEIQSGSYGECIIAPGDHPDACYILAKGVVSSHVPGHGGAVQTFLAGACFGHGALLDAEGRCAYAAQVSLLVDCVDAEFHLLNRKALEMLPDVINEHIQAQLKVAQVQDPIRQDVKNVIKNDLRWLREKQSIYAEFYRCSCCRNLALSPLTTDLDKAILAARRQLEIPDQKMSAPRSAFQRPGA